MQIDNPESFGDGSMVCSVEGGCPSVCVRCAPTRCTSRSSSCATSRLALSLENGASNGATVTWFERHLSKPAG